MVITEVDRGGAFTLTVGALAFLRLSGAYMWDPPEVEGTAVDLVPVHYEADPGYQEWEVHARASGTAHIHTVGRRNPADPQAQPLLQFDVTVVVSAR